MPRLNEAETLDTCIRKAPAAIAGGTAALIGLAVLVGAVVYWGNQGFGDLSTADSLRTVAGADAADDEPLFRLVIRYDDWWATPAQSPTKAEIDRKVLEIATSHGVPITIAYVPAHPVRGSGLGSKEFAELRRDDPVLEPLRQAVEKHRVEVALHGLHHIGRRIRGDGPDVLHPGEAGYTGGDPPSGKAPVYSEFAGLPPDVQSRMIEEGIRILTAAGLPRPVSFVPPFNTYDEATCRACALHGLTILSGDRRGALPDPPDSLRLLPTTWEWPHLREHLDEMLAFAQQVGARRAVCVVLVHYFDFEESGSARAVTSLAEFDDVLGRISRDPRVCVTTLAQLAADDADIVTAARFRADRRFRRGVYRLGAVRLLPYRLLPDPRYFGAYWAPAVYEGLNRRVLLLQAATFGLLGLGGCVASLALGIVLRWRPVPVGLGLLAAAAGAAAYAFTRRMAGGAVLAVIVAGLVLPVAVRRLRRGGRATTAPGPTQEEES